jgi:MFS family permease
LTPLLKDRLFYGWVVVAVFLVISIALYGIHFSFGVFFKSIEAEFGLSRAATSAILSANVLLGGAYSFFAGRALDRYGPRVALLAMGLFVGLSLVLTSLTNALWQLFFTYSLLLAMGTGPVYVVPMSAVSRWFDKKRGLALGLSSMGVGLGTMAMAPFAAYLITNYSWRTAYLIIGLIAWGVVLPLSLLLKRDPSEVGALPDGARARTGEPRTEASSLQPNRASLRAVLRTRSFRLLALLWFLFAFNIFLVITHLVPHVTDIGFTPAQAAFVLSLVGMASIFGRLLMGVVSDRLGRRTAVATCTLIISVCMVWLIYAQDFSSLYLFALVYGFFYSGFGTTSAALVGDTFEVGNIGTVFGLLEIGFGVGAGLGPAVGGLIFDARQDYSIAFMIGALVMLVATVLVTLVRREFR